MEPLDLSEFQFSTKKQWQERAIEDLKGKSPDTLQWHYDPDVIAEPYYDNGSATVQSHSNLNLSVDPSTGKLGRVWHYLEEVFVLESSNEKDCNHTALAALNGGADGIIWSLYPGPELSLDSLFDSIAFEYCQTIFKVSKWTKTEKSLLSECVMGKNALNGWLYYDPGKIHEEAISISEVFSSAHNFRPHCFDATQKIASQLSPSQQIAYLLSEFIERTRFLLDKGMDAGKMLDQSIFCMTGDRDYFHNIAKVRALKMVISQAASEFGLTVTKSSEVMVFSYCGANQYSVIDPYVNLARATAAAMSSVIGGASCLSVSPYDSRHRITAPGVSERLSRNISNLLREESYLDKYADPSEGSYFIETLTYQIAEKGWDIMQVIERKGGFSSATAYWAEEARKLTEKEKSNVLSRKLNMVGVNNFCDLDLFSAFPTTATLHEQLNQNGHNSFSVFELLRTKTEDYLKKDPLRQRPCVAVVRIGNPPASLARFQFVQNLLPVAGLRVSSPVDWSEHIITALLGEKILFLCGSDSDYIEQGEAIVSQIKKSVPALHVCLAGNPGQNEVLFRSWGVDGFVHAKSDFPRVLSHYQQLLGIL